ncbi:MAG: hypothetical protein ACYDBV_13415 [Nitrospiria bacterium]
MNENEVLYLQVKEGVNIKSLSLEKEKEENRFIASITIYDSEFNRHTHKIRYYNQTKKEVKTLILKLLNEI